MMVSIFPEGFVAVLLVVLSLSVSAFAGDPPVTYEVAFPERAHHEAAVVVTWTGLADEALHVRVSRASPGRYALHEFAKNIYDVQATDGAGRRLEITRPDPHGWDVAGHDGTVRFAYTLFANRADGTYSQIDLEHAHLNVPASFVFARGCEERPVRIRFDLPPESDWQVITQLPSDSQGEWRTASDLQAFMDGPIEICTPSVREWNIELGGTTGTVRLAIDHDGTEADVDLFARLAEAVCLEQAAVWGELPAYDHGEYTFIACYRSGIEGDGMEHRNSTILTSSDSLEEDLLGNLSTLAHEFVHSWNVERLRPRTLEPFDFERENPCGELWLAEGFTSYYQDLALVRAGIVSLDEFAGSLERVIQRVVSSPARERVSAVDVSRAAPLFDGARWTDPTNVAETWLSYYTWGDAIAIGLDLTLRSKFAGLDLDAYMRALWGEFGRSETPYTEADLERVLAELTGDGDFARSFFDRFVRGRDVADYAALLSRAGLLLRDRSGGRGTLGHERFATEGEELRIRGKPSLLSPLRALGCVDSDVLLRVAGHELKSEDDLSKALAGRVPGEEVAIDWRGATGEKSGEVVLVALPSYELVPFERAGLPLGGIERELRDAWLGPRAPGKYSLPAKTCPSCGTRYPFATSSCSRDGKALEIARSTSPLRKNGVTAHRGDSVHHPENTMVAFESALALGCDWIELDVHRTTDGKIIVIHDEETGRVAGTNLVIAESRLENLAGLDVARRFREVLGLDEGSCPPARIPRLEDVLRLVLRSEGETRVSIQPKSNCVEDVVALVRRMGAFERVGFNDGDLAKLRRVKELEPSVPVFWDRPAECNLDRDIEIARRLGFTGLVLHRDAVSGKAVRRIRAAGLEPGAWTVNDRATLERFLDLGVERIYTDDPQLLLEIVRARTGSGEVRH